MYVFFFTRDKAENQQKKLNTLMHLSIKNKIRCFVVDIAIHDGLPWEEKIAWGNRICIYGCNRGCPLRRTVMPNKDKMIS